MSLISTLTSRYTTKEYDTQKPIPKETIEQLLLSMQYAPSSLNLQPWHFFVAHDLKGRERIARSTCGMNAYNAPRVKNASHVIVMCARASLKQDYLDLVLHKEENDHRITTAEGAQKVSSARKTYIDLHKKAGDVAQWNEQQVHIALGFLLFAAASLEIDATAIGGFDQDILSQELQLKEQGLVPCVLVSLGHHASTDWNKNKPKSRLDKNEIFTLI